MLGGARSGPATGCERHDRAAALRRERLFRHEHMHRWVLAAVRPLIRRPPPSLAQLRLPRARTPSALKPASSFRAAGTRRWAQRWQNEAHFSLKEFGTDKFDIVYPPSSILAEPPVAVVDQGVDKKGMREVAQAHLESLSAA